MADFPFAPPELLQPQHFTSTFDCGKDALNEFLQRHALANQRGGAAKTYVIVDATKAVVGYYSLAATSVSHEEAPDRVRQGQPRHPIPAILMARFAVDKTAQGQGQGPGRALFRDAMLRAINISQQLGVRVFVVDAKDDEAVRFYAKFRMMSAAGNPYRLYLLFKDIRSLLA